MEELNKAREIEEDLQKSLNSKKAEVEAVKVERDELVGNLDSLKDSLKETSDKLLYLTKSTQRMRS